MLMILRHVFGEDEASLLWLWVELQIRLQNRATRTNCLISVYAYLTVAGN